MRSARVVATIFVSLISINVASQTPTPRAWLGGSTISGSLFTVGGGTCSGSGCAQFGGNETSTVEAYDPTANTWSAKASLSAPRFGLAATTVNGLIYALGGTSGTSSAPLSTVEAYDPTSNSWLGKASMPTARWKPTASAVNGIIYAIGGGAGGNQCVPSATVEAYDTASDSWSSKASMPTARWGAASVVLNDAVYVVGGSQQCPQIIVTPSAVLEIYDPATNTWTAGPSMPTARWDLAAAEANGKLYAIGGWDPIAQKALQTVEQYDPGTNAWTTKSVMPTARTGLVATTINGKIYAFGGNDGVNVLATLEIYDPATDTWSVPTTTGTETIQLICRPIDAEPGRLGAAVPYLGRHCFLLSVSSQETHTYGAYPIRGHLTPVRDYSADFPNGQPRIPGGCGTAVLTSECVNVTILHSQTFDGIVQGLEQAISAGQEGVYDKVTNNSNAWMQRRIDALNLAVVLPQDVLASQGDLCRLLPQIEGNLQAAGFWQWKQDILYYYGLTRCLF